MWHNSISATFINVLINLYFFSGLTQIWFTTFPGKVLWAGGSTLAHCRLMLRVENILYSFRLRAKRAVGKISRDLSVICGQCPLLADYNPQKEQVWSIFCKYKVKVEAYLCANSEHSTRYPTENISYGLLTMYLMPIFMFDDRRE